MMHHHGTYWTGCDPHARAAWEEAAPWVAAASGLFFGAAAFGVRRPLRFLAFQLGLDETQTREVARILDELKTERAQASVDHRHVGGARRRARRGQLRRHPGGRGGAGAGRERGAHAPGDGARARPAAPGAAPGAAREARAPHPDRRGGTLSGW